MLDILFAIICVPIYILLVVFLWGVNWAANHSIDDNVPTYENLLGFSVHPKEVHSDISIAWNGDGHDFHILELSETDTEQILTKKDSILAQNCTPEDEREEQSEKEYSDMVCRCQQSQDENFEVFVSLENYMKKSKKRTKLNAWVHSLPHTENVFQMRCTNAFGTDVSTYIFDLTNGYILHEAMFM